MNLYEEQEFTKRFDFSLWRKLFNFVRPYKKYFIQLCVFMILIGGIDAVFPILSKIAVDNFIDKNTLDGFWIFCTALFIIILLQAYNVRQMIRVAGKIETGVPYDIRKVAFQKLQQLPLTFFDRTPVGWIMARLTSDVRRLGTALSWNMVDMIWAVSMMIIMQIFMFLLNWKLALIILASVPVLIIISIVFQNIILNNFRKVRKINSKITGAFNEGIMGAKTIKALGLEEESLNEFSKLAGEMRNFSVRTATVASLYTPVVLVLGSIVTGLVLWRGGIQITDGSVSYGTLVAFVSYTVQFFEPVKQFARVFSELQYAQASGERVLSLIETQVDIKDSDGVIEKYGDIFNPHIDKWPEFKGNISFRNVSFAYKDGEKVLENFNLEVKAGETIALVGETGSGKTTIVNLACRFYEPTEGEILIDGEDYRKRPLLWLYSNIGYVLQEPYLFSGTVRENIAYGRLDATEEEIIRAAKIVNAHDFIMKLEKGYDTDVGERGGKLSTGQKQLISFARAILADPGMFILDEATSSVDTETEALIQEAIHKALKGRTSFIIAHRLSTIRSADRILVIDKGKIIEQGTHDELIRKRGHYYRLYTNQFIEEQESKVLAGS